MYKTEVYILGQKYTIKGEKPPEYIQKLAAYVDEQLRKVYEKNPSIPPLRAAILTCLYITNELFESQQNLEKTQLALKKLEEKTTELITLLD